VPVAELSPFTLVGFTETEDKPRGAAAVTVIVVVVVIPFKYAVIVSGIVVAVEMVVTGKVAVVEPAATVTLAGTNAGEPFVHR